MQLKAIYIYPIKSLGGFAVQQSVVTQRGLKLDRRYMLVNKAGEFLTQRNMAELALFRVKQVQNGFEVWFDNSHIFIPETLNLGQKIEVTVWDDKVEALLADATINNWFSQHLNTTVQLVYLPDESLRNVPHPYAKNNEQVSFADAYPILIISEASLYHLNNQLDEKIGMDRFRPNMVVTGCDAHAEDLLQTFFINNAQFRFTKPCARCHVTTINQQTAVKGVEPLKTLATYRTENHKINFGANVMVLSTGEIAVGQNLMAQPQAE